MVPIGTPPTVMTGSMVFLRGVLIEPCCCPAPGAANLTYSEESCSQHPGAPSG